MDQEVQACLKWISLNEQVGIAGLVCQRSGISRPTLRKWPKRYEEFGLEGLQERSRRPKTLLGRR